MGNKITEAILGGAISSCFSPSFGNKYLDNSLALLWSYRKGVGLKPVYGPDFNWSYAGYQVVDGEPVYGNPDGVELWDDTSVNADSSWSYLGGGIWECDGTLEAANLSVDNVLNSGDYAKIVFEIVERTSGEVYTVAEGSTSGNIYASDVGEHSVTMIAGSYAKTGLRSSSFIGKVQVLSIKKHLPIPAIDPVLGMYCGGGWTEEITNTSCSGGGVGVAPYNWQVQQGNGVVLSVAGTGLNYIDIKIDGTALASTYPSIYFDITPATISTGDTLSLGCGVCVIEGDLPDGLTMNLSAAYYDSSSVYVSSSSTQISTGQSNHKATVTDETAASAKPRLNFTILADVVVDVTIRISKVSLVKGKGVYPFVSTSGSKITVSSAAGSTADNGAWFDMIEYVDGVARHKAIKLKECFRGEISTTQNLAVPSGTFGVISGYLKWNFVNYTGNATRDVDAYHLESEMDNVQIYYNSSDIGADRLILGVKASKLSEDFDVAIMSFMNVKRYFKPNGEWVYLVVNLDTTSTFQNLRVAGVNSGRAVDVEIEDVFIINSLDVNVGISGTIVCLGDSITAGYQYPEYLGEILNNDTVINSGIVGNTLPQMIARFDTDVTAYAPDYVFVMGGINDINGGATIDDLITNYSTIISLVSGIGAELIIVENIPFGGLASWTIEKQETLDALRAWLKLQPCFAFIQTYDDLLDSRYQYAMIEEGSADGLHPGAYLTRIIVDNILNEVGVSWPEYIETTTDQINVGDQLTPAEMTIGVAKTMDIASSDMTDGDVHNILSSNDTETVPLYFGMDSTGSFVAASDGTNTVKNYCAWDALDKLFIDLEADGPNSQMRLGVANYTDGDTEFAFSDYGTFQGYFADTGNALRVALNVTGIPDHFIDGLVYGEIRTPADMFKEVAKYAV